MQIPARIFINVSPEAIKKRHMISASSDIMKMKECVSRFCIERTQNHIIQMQISNHYRSVHRWLREQEVRVLQRVRKRQRRRSEMHVSKMREFRKFIKNA